MPTLQCLTVPPIVVLAGWQLQVLLWTFSNSLISCLGYVPKVSHTSFSKHVARCNSNIYKLKPEDAGTPPEVDLGGPKKKSLRSLQAVRATDISVTHGFKLQLHVAEIVSLMTTWTS